MKPVAEQTLYEILEVPFDAPESEIVKAWERAEALYGPGSLTTYTLVSPDEAAALGAKLEEALNVLLDPTERMRYDARIRGRTANGARRDDGAGAWARQQATSLPPIIPPLQLVPPVEADPDGNDVRISVSPREALEGAGDAVDGDAHGATQEEAAPGRAEPAGPEPEPAASADGTEQAMSPEPDEPPASAGACELAAGEAPGDAADPPPILLCRVVAEPGSDALSTPPPTSPPFAALLESPAALAVSPLACPAASEPPQRHAEPPAVEREFVAPEGAPYTGDVLRRAREARGLGVPQMCERTKIARHHLENIEADQHDKLPAPVYLRGILMALARELRLDGQKVARSYLEAAASRAPEKDR